MIIGRFLPPLPIAGILVAVVTVGGLVTNSEVVGRSFLLWG